MNEEIKSKLSKIYELVKRGATEGERMAAKKAMDRILQRYNISESELGNLELRKYLFKYATALELTLISQIMLVMIEDGITRSLRKSWTKEIEAYLRYEEWITVECAYEYFRRHMKKEWNRLCAPEVKKCRTAKTKAKARKYLQGLFISQYIIRSNLYLPRQRVPVEVKNNKEAIDRVKMQDIEGGVYNRQIITNNLLN